MNQVKPEKDCSEYNSLEEGKLEEGDEVGAIRRIKLKDDGALDQLIRWYMF